MSLADPIPVTEAPVVRRTVVIDDHAMVGTALGAVLHAEADFELVAVANDISSGVAAVATHRPHVVVADLRLGDGVVTDHLQQLRAAAPDARILVVTGSPTEKALLDALDGGASGLVDKAQPVDAFVDAVRRAADGDVVVSPELAQVLVTRSCAPRRRDRATLSRRELDVLQELAGGASTADIAVTLCLSPHTVRNHVARACMKLGTHTRLQAVREAVQRGLISPY